MADSISLEQVQEQQQQLLQTVNNLISQKAQLEDQLESCKTTLLSNQGALQYANSLIQIMTEETNNVGKGNIAENITVPEVELADPEERTEEVTL